MSKDLDSEGTRPARRDFLKAGVLAGAAGLLPAQLLADPYTPAPVDAGPRRPVRVRGIVRARGRGVARVMVTDGINVVDTAPDGTFVLASSSDREFIYLSLPAGYQVPVSSTGTARFFQPLRADSRGEMRLVFDLEPLLQGDERHTMLLLADIQAEDAAEMGQFHEQTVPDLERTIAGLGDEHRFSIACGDIVFDELAMFPEFERAVRRLGIPSFQVVGNHDLDKDGATYESSTRTFRSRYGPPYYSFTRGRVHYVVLDDVFWHPGGYIGYVDADQLTWLAQDL